MFIPSVIQEKLIAWFGFPENKIHAQVATLFKDKPHIRTMLLFEVTLEGELIFLTHTQTQKWKDLEASSHIAIALVHGSGQLTIEGNAYLESENTLKRELYWKRLVPSVQKIYISSPKDTVPESFGIIRVQPSSWEILELNEEEYTKSTREQFFNINGILHSQRLQPL